MVLLNQINTAKVLERALELTANDRAATHGPKWENHQNIASLWSAYLGKVVTPHDVCVMMVLLKIARTKLGKFNEDDYVDGAAYMAIAAEMFGQNGVLESMQRHPAK